MNKFFKYLTRKSNLMVILMALVCGISVSCGDDDPPTTPPSNPPSSTTEPTTPDTPTTPTTYSIKVNGLESTNLVFQGGFDGKSGIDYQQKVTIDSNVEWNASGIPSWLSVSPTKGNGKIEMSIYPTSENNSADPRTATIKLIGGNTSASIEITQSDNLSTAKVTPSNLVALYNAIGWELVESGATVNKFHWLCVSESEMNRLTDAELLNELLKQEELKFVDDYMFFPAYDSNRKEITQNTTYYICTVAFDMNEKRGEVVKSKVTTPRYADGDNDAWVSFPNVQYNSYSFSFDAVKEGFCDTYHVIFGNLPIDESYSHVAFAFEINYFKKNGKKHWLSDLWDLEIMTDYPNNHTFTHVTFTLSIYPLITIFARGVFKDGSESSDLRGGYLDVSGNNARELSRTISKPREDVIIRRSVEEARVKKYKK